MTPRMLSALLVAAGCLCMAITLLQSGERVELSEGLALQLAEGRESKGERADIVYGGTVKELHSAVPEAKENSDRSVEEVRCSVYASVSLSVLLPAINACSNCILKYILRRYFLLSFSSPFFFRCIPLCVCLYIFHIPFSLFPALPATPHSRSTSTLLSIEANPSASWTFLAFSSASVSV